MMTDKRSFDGWRRLSLTVMVDVGRDDPMGLKQVKQELDKLGVWWAMAMAELAGARCDKATCGHVHYSHGEIARELGVSREAVSKVIRRVA